MSYIKKLNTILVFLIFLAIKSDAQSINLYTLNITISKFIKTIH
jgi:hypothetical protein